MNNTNYETISENLDIIKKNIKFLKNKINTIKKGSINSYTISLLSDYNKSLNHFLKMKKQYKNELGNIWKFTHVRIDPTYTRSVSFLSYDEAIDLLSSLTNYVKDNMYIHPTERSQFRLDL